MPHLHDLPDWDDLRRHSYREEDEESWKRNSTTEACKAMYRQWQQVAYLLNGVLPDEDCSKDNVSAEMRGHIAAQIWGDVMQAAVKMRSSVHLQYVSRMESAAIIRKSAQDVALALWSLQEFGEDDDDDKGLEEHHRQVLRDEIDAFRALFRDWVATFRREPDEMEDEWGLFM